MSDPQDVARGLTDDQKALYAQAFMAGQMKGFQAAEQNLAAAKEMGYQMALDRVAEMDAATRARSQTRHEDRVAARAAEMEQAAADEHERNGTREWKGVDNGDQLPSADWDDDGDG